MKIGFKHAAALVLFMSVNGATSLIAASVKGSIPVTANSEKDHPNMAKISLQDAIAAALEKVPGKAIEADLGTENGFLVYDVTIVSNGNKETEVTVDAGDKSILKTEEDVFGM